MDNKTRNLSVLFADICGSTAFYESMGDEIAQRLMSSCITTLSATASAHQGTVIKTIGDAVMCTFPTANGALQAACAMQTAVQNTNYHGNNLHISIGFHYGSVICEAGDVFGDTVNVAARISSHARAHQIMTSQAVVQEISEELRLKTKRITTAEFKGKQIEFDIFIVNWNEEDQGCTHIRPPMILDNRKSAKQAQLTLHYSGQELTLSQEKKKLTLGRGKNCDFVMPTLPDSPVSRLHASVEARFGKFFIVDQSVNGTYIRSEDGNVNHIIRKEMVLQGTGTISPGRSFSEIGAELLTYSIS